MTRAAIVLTCASLLLLPALSSAEDAPALFPARPARDMWHVCWTDQCAAAGGASARPVQLRVAFALPPLAGAPSDPAQRARPVVIEYSAGYRLRRKIHMYASIATLPLFGAELALGQSLYNNTPSDQSSRRGLHAALGAGIMGLFAVNTVTGAWNLFGEGRKDPHGRTLRIVHGLLMMAADAGFVATSLSGPNSRAEETPKRAPCRRRKVGLFTRETRSRARRSSPIWAETVALRRYSRPARAGSGSSGRTGCPSVAGRSRSGRNAQETSPSPTSRAITASRS